MKKGILWAKLSKSTAILSAAAMLAAVMPISASAETPGVEEFSDNFDSYGVSGLRYEKGQNGAWTSPYVDDDGTEHASTATDNDGNYLINSEDVVIARDPDFGDDVWIAKTMNRLWGTWNTSAAGIIQAPGGKEDGDNALAICSYTTDAATYPTVALSGLDILASNVYTYKFDIYKSENGFDGKTGGGIRFNVSPDRKSYYELQLPGNNSTVGNYGGIRKVTDGSSEILASSVNTNGLGGDTWYTVTLTVDNGIFEWSVVTPDGNELQIGSCADSGTLIEQSGSHIEFFAGGQGNTFVLYDNITITRNAAVQEDTGDFESLPITQVTEPAEGADITIAGKWKAAAGQMGADIQILQDGSHGNVLAIEAKKAWEQRPAYPTAYNITMLTPQKTDYNYKFDIKRIANDRGNGGGGIRFNYVDNNNFYELHFGAGNTGDGNGTMLFKRVNGVETRLNADIKTFIDDNEQGIWTLNNRIMENVWYTVDLKVLGGIIEWTVCDADGNIVSVGSYNDCADYFESPGMGTRFFGAGQFGAYVYFDNISVTPIEKDDGSFEKFSVTEKNSDSRWSLPLAGEWYIPAAQTDDAHFAIAEENGNKALKITSAATEDNGSAYAEIGNSTWVSPRDGVQTFDFDMWKESFSSGGGLRFNESSDGRNYYELVFGETNDLEANPEEGLPERENDRARTMVRRVENGEEKLLDLTLSINSEFNNVWNTISKYQGMKPGIWNTVHLEVIGGKISFTVYIKDNGQYMGGKTCITGSCADPNPLPETGTYSRFASFGGYTMIDNAAKTWEGIDTGDFEAFDVTDDMTVRSTGANYKDAKIAGDWYLRGRYSVNELSGSNADDAPFAIAKNPKGGGKVLKVSAGAAWDNPWKFPMAYNRKWTANSDAEAIYKFDFFLNDARIGAGLRFNYIKADENDKSFYQLCFGGGNCGNKTTLKKLTNGQLYHEGVSGQSDIITLSPTVETQEGESTSISANVWYTAEISVNGGEISWTLKKAADGTLVEKGIYTDSNPISGDNMMAMLFGTGQNGTFAYFDNTSFIQNAPAEEYEIKDCSGNGVTVYAPAAGKVIVAFAAYANEDDGTQRLVCVSYEEKELAAKLNSIAPGNQFNDALADYVRVMMYSVSDNSPLCASAKYDVE